jgi:hypothetical protein
MKTLLEMSPAVITLHPHEGDSPPSSRLGLLVADLFHPVHRLAVELFLNGNVRHGGGWCGAMSSNCRMHHGGRGIRCGLQRRLCQPPEDSSWHNPLNF